MKRVKKFRAVGMVAFILICAAVNAQETGCPAQETYPVKAELHLSIDKYFLISVRKNSASDFDTLRDVRVWVQNMTDKTVVFTAMLNTFNELTFEEDIPCLIEDNEVTGSNREGYCIATSERKTPFTIKEISCPVTVHVTLESRQPYLVLKSNAVEFRPPD